MYIGIVQIWHYPTYSTIQQTTAPWWAICHYGGMALGNQFIPPPGAYSEGVGWSHGERNLLKLIIWRRKKLICKLDNFILVFICLPTLLPPKQWYCASPHASRLAHILSILSSMADACFWLVVVWAVVDRRPSKGNGVFYIFFFIVWIRHLKWLDAATPHAPTPMRLLSNIYPTAAADNYLIVVSSN